MSRRDALVAAGTLTAVWLWQTAGWELILACVCAAVGIAAGWSVWWTPERGPESDRRYAARHRA